MATPPTLVPLADLPSQLEPVDLAASFRVSTMSAPRSRAASLLSPVECTMRVEPAPPGFDLSVFPSPYGFFFSSGSCFRCSQICPHSPLRACWAYRAALSLSLLSLPPLYLTLLPFLCLDPDPYSFSRTPPRVPLAPWYFGNAS